MEEKARELQITALKNGIVIDHIPSEKVFAIVELLKFLDMDEVKQSTIREVKEDMKRKIGEGENYLQSRVLEMIRDIMGIIIENRETTVTKVTFLSNKENICAMTKCLLSL